MIFIKKLNKLCICLDPKDLNKQINLILNIEDILVKLSKAKLCLVVDYKNEFWQVKLTESSSLLTTFWTPVEIIADDILIYGIGSTHKEAYADHTKAC